ncbi:RidA family protein [Allonocardiopsis opalescens]|nr:RidA family protein [Allonocardiopsis opalescens]
MATTPGYSAALTVSGPLVFVSGQVPVAADGSVAEGDAAEQTRQVFRNIELALAGQQARMDQIVKLTFFLCRIGDLAEVRAARDEFITREPRPTSSLVEVSRLIDPRFLVEIEAVASLGP